MKEKRNYAKSVIVYEKLFEHVLLFFQLSRVKLWEHLYTGGWLVTVTRSVLYSGTHKYNIRIDSFER